jgi:uncharacterized protein YjiS (DUF1127 family)
MRDYVLHEARSRAAWGQWSWLVRAVQNWRTRRDVRQLMGWSDAMLMDIGLTRSDLLRFSRRPLDEDAEWEATRATLLSSRNASYPRSRTTF